MKIRFSLLFPFIIAGLLFAHEAPRKQSLSVAVLQGVDTDLPLLLPKLIDGSLVYEDAHLYTLSYVHSFSVYAIGYADLLIGAEGVLGKHYGIQDHMETAVALHLKLAGLLPRKMPVNLDYAIGNGLSYAFGEPYYEDTPKDQPDKHYRLQYFISMDLDFYARDFPRLQLMLRLHHRSGIYGVVAPQRVGSNFIGYGIKYLF